MGNLEAALNKGTVNFSRQKHQIDVLQVSFNSLRSSGCLVSLIILPLQSFNGKVDIISSDPLCYSDGIYESLKCLVLTIPLFASVWMCKSPVQKNYKIKKMKITIEKNLHNFSSKGLRYKLKIAKYEIRKCRKNFAKKKRKKNTEKKLLMLSSQSRVVVALVFAEFFCKIIFLEISQKLFLRKVFSWNFALFRLNHFHGKMQNFGKYERKLRTFLFAGNHT